MLFSLKRQALHIALQTSQRLTSEKIKEIQTYYEPIPMIISLAVLFTALLFGGMTLYSFGFAGFLFTALPSETAGPTLRRAFPLFYLFVIATATIAALLWWPSNATYAGVLAAIALSTIPLRQILMPAINQATDAGQRQRFKWLHGLSVLITLGHIVAAGWLLVQIA
jgi:hypothetical protein